MKMTVVTTKEGALVGAMYGYAPEPNLNEVIPGEPMFRAGLMAGPGQEVHTIEVGDRVLKIDSPVELHAFLEGEVRKVRK